MPCSNDALYMCNHACDSFLVLMISFCTGVDIMARYQLLNNNNDFKKNNNVGNHIVDLLDQPFWNGNQGRNILLS